MGEEDAYEGAEDSRISEIENSNGGLEKALLVEDNLMNRKVATKLLKQINVSAKEAESGEKALSLMAEEGFDIVLLDIHMPDMNGFEVAKAIRQNSNRVVASKVPIVAISADIYSETKDKAHQAGIDDFIEKPIDINKLQDAIKRIGKQMG